MIAYSIDYKIIKSGKIKTFALMQKTPRAQKIKLKSWRQSRKTRPSHKANKPQRQEYNY